MFGSPENEGFDREAVIKLLAEQNVPFEVVGGSDLTDCVREDVYVSEAIPAAGNRYQIRNVFGSRRHGGGPYFGTAVPALIVLEDGRPIDVYPHRSRDGEVTSIRRFLQTR